MGQLANARIVNNTFENAVGGMTSADVSQRQRRLGQQHRRRLGLPPGLTFRGNVGKKCDASDVGRVAPDVVRAADLHRRQIAPMGWVDSVGFDFHLKADSPAVGAANAAYAPATDRDGKRRDGDPDSVPTSTGSVARPAAGRARRGRGA